MIKFATQIAKILAFLLEREAKRHQTKVHNARYADRRALKKREAAIEAADARCAEVIERAKRDAELDRAAAELDAFKECEKHRECEDKHLAKRAEAHRVLKGLNQIKE